MPQLIDIVMITALNKNYCKTKNNRFKLRHTPYLNRCQQCQAHANQAHLVFYRPEIDHRNKTKRA